MEIKKADYMQARSIAKFNKMWKEGLLSESERLREIMKSAAKRKYTANAVYIADIGIRHTSPAFFHDELKAHGFIIAEIYKA